jgi:hypothetical protein
MDLKAVLTLLMILGAPAIHAGTLDGNVIGINDTPRPYVRVELHGPEGKTVFTGANGRFSVVLAGGKYVVQVIQGDRAAQFNVVIADQGVVTQSFKLSW